MPPPLREICDSEDEDEILSISNDAAGQATTRGEVAPEPHVPDQIMETSRTSDHSTAPTEELLRQAHLDLMAPTQPAIEYAGPTSSFSPNLTRVKRRLTGTDATPPPTASTGKLKRIKTTPIRSNNHATGSTIPGPTIPRQSDVATSDTIQHYPDTATDDTIPGETMPAASAIDGQTPSSRLRMKSPTHQPSSGHHSSNLTPWSVSVVGNSSANASNKNISSDPPRSDDHLIGLPKEQYKPRPSRSRSEKASLCEPVDYSVAPEKAVKSKRARTIAHSPAKHDDMDIGPRIFPQNPILQAPEFEALSPPSASAFQTNLPEVPDLPTIDGKLPQTIPQTASDAAPPTTQTRKGSKKGLKPKKTPGTRGRPRKVAQVVPDEPDELANEESVQQRGTKTEVQVVITPREHTPALPADNLQTHSDVSHILAALQKYPAKPTEPPVEPTPSITEPMEPSVEPFEPPADFPFEKKLPEKKTPAPKKAPVKKLTKAQQKKADKIAEAKLDEERLVEEKLAEKENEPMDKASNEPELEDDAADNKPASISHASDTPKPDLTTLDVKVAEAIKTPATAKKAAQAKGSPSISSLLGSKYRVGLSKTQKTQPLLKVFRK